MIKAKISKWDFLKLKFLHIKGNHQQNKKAKYGIGKNIYKSYILQGANVPNIKNSYNSIAKKKKESIWLWAEDLNRHFSKEGIQVANWHMKRCPTTLIREMQIKTTMRYHLTPVRMAVIKKITNDRCWWGWSKGTLVQCW